VAEPNLAGSLSAENERHSQSENVLKKDSTSHAYFQPTLDSAIQPTTHGLEEYPHLWEQQYQALLEELAQAQKLAQKRLDRVYQLEQALDESLASLQSLRMQLVDQHLLEAHLASTEEISNIQQQAINHLKLQLTQQQQVLEAQIQETQAREQTFQDLLTATEVLTQGQQVELERLRHQIAHDWAEGQAHQSRLEKQLENLQSTLSNQQQRATELEAQVASTQTVATNLEAQLNEAQGQVNSLSQDLDDRQASLTQLETELKQAYAALEEQQAIITQLEQNQSATRDQNSAILSLNRELALAQARIEELIQHQGRVVDLEQQTTEMQEQILKQAKQASEYETAVQHWKDRCVAGQQHAMRLQELLHPLLMRLVEDPAIAGSKPEIEALLGDLLQTLQSPTMTGSSPPPLPTAPPANPSPKVDLPDFLAKRRRNYRVR
jgi:DNA repair exonuclease SbcCD ATPase subunit